MPPILSVLNPSKAASEAKTLPMGLEESRRQAAQWGAGSQAAAAAPPPNHLHPHHHNHNHFNNGSNNSQQTSVEPMDDDRTRTPPSADGDVGDGTVGGGEVGVAGAVVHHSTAVEGGINGVAGCRGVGGHGTGGWGGGAGGVREMVWDGGGCQVSSCCYAADRVTCVSI